MFPQIVTERIGHYVYFLRDPRNNEIFYVGKGVDNRVFNHIACAQTSNEDAQNLKYERIREIGSGNVEHIILRHGLDNKTAEEVEAAIIDLIGLEKLTNIQSGYDSSEYGIKTIDEIIALYETEELDPNPDEKCILININRHYKSDLSAEELYEVTRKFWVIGSRRQTIQYAVPTYKGITREVYEVKNWFQSEDGKRWGFEGKIANVEVRNRLRLKSIAPFIKHGASNPIRYVEQAVITATDRDD